MIRTRVQGQEKSWAIVGGGFLGMTLALRLAQQGRSVSLFEGAPTFGGLASAWQLGDIVWDRHYHVTLLSDTHLRSLLRELGLEREMEWKVTRTGFYIDSKFYSLSNALEFLKFPPLSLVGKLRLGATVFYASRVTDWKSLEKILVADWLRRWSGQDVLDKIWLPLLRAKLGENYRETSAAFIWATISRMYAARRAGMKKEVFGYVPGGYARVIERFREVLERENVRCHVGKFVTKVHSTSCGGVQLALSDGTSETFERAILTMAAPVAARLCPQLSDAEKSRMNGIKYQGIICASLLFKEPLSDFYITNITDSWVPYTAVIDMSALVDRKNFGGLGLVYLPKYVPSDAPEFNLSDEHLEERFVNALERMYPTFKRKSLLSFRVSRVRYLLPISTLAYSDKLPAMSTSLSGVHIVNSAHIVNGTLNVNETVQLAERTAVRLAGLPEMENLPPHIGDHAFREADGQPLAGSRQ